MNSFNKTSKHCFGGLCATILALCSISAAHAQIPPIVAIPAGLNPSSGPVYNTPSGFNGVPVTLGLRLFASGGEVDVTDLGPTGADYDEQLFVASPPSPYGLFMDNHSTPNGTTYDLGTFAAGTEIEFGIYVITTGNVWYDGPGSRNVDGDVHAYLVSDYQGLPNTTYVGFEDLDGSIADFNYTDEIYAFTGAVGAVTEPTQAPEPSTYAMLLGGVGALIFWHMRLRRSRV